MTAKTPIQRVAADARKALDAIEQKLHEEHGDYDLEIELITLSQFIQRMENPA